MLKSESSHKKWYDFLLNLAKGRTTLCNRTLGFLAYCSRHAQALLCKFAPLLLQVAYNVSVP